jgi:hypothetical protein
LRVIIDQSSYGGTVFQMPVDLQVTTLGGEYTVVIENDQAHQEYVLPVPAGETVVDVRLDPDNWILKQVLYLGTGAETPGLPTTFRLDPVYPNPFNAGTMITYHLPREGVVHLEIRNLLGARVWGLERRQPAGDYSVRWGGRDARGRVLPAGVYFLRASADDRTLTRKLVLLR